RVHTRAPPRARAGGAAGEPQGAPRAETRRGRPRSKHRREREAAGRPPPARSLSPPAGARSSPPSARRRRTPPSLQRAHPDPPRCEPWPWSVPPTRLWAPRECKSRGNNYPDRVGGPTMLNSRAGCQAPYGLREAVTEMDNQMDKRLAKIESHLG